MAEFSYKAVTTDGKVVEGIMEAADNGTVALRLQEMGLLPVRVGAAAKKNLLTREIPWPWKRKKVRRKDLLVFTHELHTLVRSGIPLDRSLAVLGKLAESPALAEVIQNVLKAGQGGQVLLRSAGRVSRGVSQSVCQHGACRRSGRRPGGNPGPPDGLPRNQRKPPLLRDRRSDLPGTAVGGGSREHDDPDDVRCAQLCRGLPRHGRAVAAADDDSDRG